MNRSALMLLFLASCSSSWAKTYDLEADIGLVAEDPSSATAVRNTQLLSAALEAQHAAGQFRFQDSTTGPVLHPITCAGKEFYFTGTITTGIRYGGALKGASGRVPLLPSGHYRAGGTMGGLVTRFTRIDGEKGGAILRLRGVGFHLSGIQFLGRPFVNDPTGEGPDGSKSLPRATNRTPVGVEIEGRSSPPTGRHTIRDCAIAECGIGVCCRGGYYDAAGKFIPKEDHADNGIIQGVVFTACDICFRTENQQAVCWSLRDIDVNGFGGVGTRPTTVIDCQRAGGIWADGISINHPQSTLIRVGKGFSQWANWLDVRNVKWDRTTWKGCFYRVFQYDGPADASLADKHWQVRVTGHLGYDRHWAEHPPDVSQLVDVPRGFPLTGLLFDIERLNDVPDVEERFELVGGGPWVRPKGK